MAQTITQFPLIDEQLVTEPRDLQCIIHNLKSSASQQLPVKGYTFWKPLRLSPSSGGHELSGTKLGIWEQDSCAPHLFSFGVK